MTWSAQIYPVAPKFHNNYSLSNTTKYVLASYLKHTVVVEMHINPTFMTFGALGAHFLSIFTLLKSA